MLRKYFSFFLSKKESFCFSIRHWCCVNEQPITTETQTKIEYGTHVVTTKTKVYIR
jgi:hypothetical protein